MKPLQQSIKLSLNIITKAIKQLPQDKRTILTSRVNSVLTKYVNINNEQSLQKLQKFKKQLDFNLNFVKLSHPNLDYTPPTQPQIKSSQTKPKSQSQSQQNSQDKQDSHAFKLVNNQEIQVQRLKNDTFDTQIQRQKSARTQVQFSNWFDGNVDPQQLKRHKQLLQRQHFQGQFWKDKSKPQSYAKQYMKNMLASKIEGKQPPKKDKKLQDHRPVHVQQNQNVWEKIKR